MADDPKKLYHEELRIADGFGCRMFRMMNRSVSRPNPGEKAPRPCDILSVRLPERFWGA